MVSAPFLIKRYQHLSAASNLLSAGCTVHVEFHDIITCQCVISMVNVTVIKS